MDSPTRHQSKRHRDDEYDPNEGRGVPTPSKAKTKATKKKQAASSQATGPRTAFGPSPPVVPRRAPTAKDKGKGVETSAPQEPEDVAPKARRNRAPAVLECTLDQVQKRENWCSYRFISRQAHEFYLRKPVKYSVQPEKAFPYSNEMIPPLHNFYISHNLDELNKLVEANEYTSAEVTREFVANFLCNEDGETKGTDYVYFRRRFVLFTPQVIRMTMGYPEVEAGECGYRAARGEPGIRETVGVWAFGGAGVVQWNRVENSRVVKPVRWLCEWVDNWLLGLSKQNFVSFDSALIAYCLYHGRKVDLGQIIYDAFSKRKDSSDNKGPGFPLLTQMILEGAGIEIPNELKKLKRKPTRFFRKVLGAADYERNEPRDSDEDEEEGFLDPAELADSPPRPSRAAREGEMGINEKLDAMLANQARMEEKQNSFFSWVKKGISKIANQCRSNRDTQVRMGDQVNRLSRWTEQIAQAQNIELDPAPGGQYFVPAEFPAYDEFEQFFFGEGSSSSHPPQ